MSWSLVQRVALVLLCSSAPLALAQDVDPLAKLDPNSRYQIELILDSARAGGLPSRPLLSKAYEGVSKRAGARSIVAAVRSLHENMKVARSALGTSISEDEFSAAATVLQAGVPVSTLTKFRGERGGKPLLRALIVLGDLITRGVPREEASSAIVKLWQNGGGDADFYGLWKGVEQDILSGQTPGAALQQRAREFPGRAPDPLSKQPPSVRPPETPSS